MTWGKQFCSLSPVPECLLALDARNIFLPLNLENVELVLVWTRRKTLPLLQLLAGGSIRQPAATVHNLGVICESSLSFDDPLRARRQNRVHLQSAASLRPGLSQEGAESIIHAFITSQLDYRNALFTGLPDRPLQKPQRSVNFEAGVLTGDEHSPLHQCWDLNRDSHGGFKLSFSSSLPPTATPLQLQSYPWLSPSRAAALWAQYTDFLSLRLSVFLSVWILSGNFKGRKSVRGSWWCSANQVSGWQPFFSVIEGCYRITLVPSQGPVCSYWNQQEAGCSFQWEQN